MPDLQFTNATVILADRLLAGGHVRTAAGRIAAVGTDPVSHVEFEAIDLGGAYLAPGFVDLHAHGGDGADFMDGSAAAFRTVCRAHARHGTTSLLPTSTVARHEQIVAFLDLCRRFRSADTGSARALGAHFYGPYFAPAARGCHPPDPLRPPDPTEFAAYLDFADAIATATVAPELPGAEAFAHACRDRGVRLNAGHSHATFAQLEMAVGWGVRHVDHLFCAMSDRARLRQAQPYPMRGGVFEATLFFDELTTEVIADGRHLAPELLRLAYKVKGPDRLALVTDANRALGMPDGEYVFGPLDGGTPFVRHTDVGLTPDRTGLASGVMGLDHAVRVMAAATGASLPEVVRMATLTPARIAGWDAEVGSIAVGKRADFLVLDRELNVRAVYRDGCQIV